MQHDESGPCYQVAGRRARGLAGRRTVGLIQRSAGVFTRRSAGGLFNSLLTLVPLTNSLF